jgi:N-acetylmuramoyl-L-alanine amidase
MAYYESSLLFASEVVDKLIVNPLTPRRVVIDQDIFQVLVEANMPAVLLELAFVTNPSEYKYMSAPAGQDEIAGRLFNAFKSYKSKFDQSVSVERIPTTTPAPVSAPAPAPKPKSQAKPAPKQQETASVPKTALKQGEYYSIQVMSLSRLLNASDPAFKSLNVSSINNDGSGTYKYICGKFTTFDEAGKKIKAVKQEFPQAFIVKVSGNHVEKAN